MADFEVLRGKVKKLLDANDASPEIEKLPVSSFDLDLTNRDQKLKAGRDICENLRLELEHNISETRRVSKWIREVFWDPQQVLGKCLFAILGTIQVTNYPEVSEATDEKYHFQWANFCQKTAYDILEDDKFEPWRIYTAEGLQVELNKKQKVYCEHERRLDLLLENDDDQEELEEEKVAIVKADLEEQRAMQGKSGYFFY